MVREYDAALTVPAALIAICVGVSFVCNRSTNAYRIWEAASLSSPPHAISFGIEALAPHQCCGSWNKDGSVYFFQALVNGFWQIFAQPGNQGIFVRSSYTADQLTTGLVQYSSPVASPDSDRLYVLSQSHKSEVVRYDLATQQWTPIAEGVPADTAAFSKDGKSQAFTRMPDHTLWRCSMPGCTSPVQLTFAPVRATMPRWSPNGQKIACMTRTAGGAWQATLISVAGGPAFHIPAGAGAADPSWSPEGNRIAFAAVPGQNQRSAQPIQIYDMGKKETTEIRGAEGYDSPLWSPDGLFLAAVRSDSRELAFYEFSTGKWRHSPGTRAGYLNWSSDSKRVYFLSPAGDTPASVMTVDVATMSKNRVVDLSGIRRPASGFGEWIGLDHSDSPLALRDLSTEQILTWRFERY